jgi:hypothetical protein
MRNEDRYWMIVVGILASAMVLVVTVGFGKYRDFRDRVDADEIRRIRSLETDASIERIGESIGRIEQGVNILQIEVLKTHVRFLERALERCGCCEVERDFVPVPRAGDNEDPNRWTVPNEEE